jgi:DNA-directed RNA polymerase specialized sigma24 family protein
MGRNLRARVQGDRVVVRKLAALGHLTFKEIAERTNIPLGTVCRYASEARANGESPARRAGSRNLRLPGEMSDG